MGSAMGRWPIGRESPDPHTAGSTAVTRRGCEDLGSGTGSRCWCARVPGGHVSTHTYFPALSAGKAGEQGYPRGQILVSNAILHYKAQGFLEKGLIQGWAGNLRGS